MGRVMENTKLKRIGGDDLRQDLGGSGFGGSLTPARVWDGLRGARNKDNGDPRFISPDENLEAEYFQI